MNNQNQSTAHCQVRTVKYKDRDYRVQKDRNGFEYIKVSENGKRVIIPLSNLEPNDPIFDYVFNFGFQKQPNDELSQKIKEMIGHKKTVQFSPKLEPQKEKIHVFVKTKIGESKEFYLPKETDVRQWLTDHNISYKYFKI